MLGMFDTATVGNGHDSGSTRLIPTQTEVFASIFGQPLLLTLMSKTIVSIERYSQHAPEEGQTMHPCVAPPVCSLPVLF